MSNTLNGVFLNAIAQESLPYLTSLFAPLRGITTDFSSTIATAGSSVTTRFATKPAVQDIASAGYAPSAAQTTARTINLDQHKGVTIGFTDIEVLQSSISFEKLFLNPMLDALGADVFGALNDLVTASNFSNYFFSTAGNFDRGDLVDIGTTLTTTLQAPKMGRFALLNSSYYGALVKTLNSAEFPGIIAEKTEGVVPRVNKFDVYESSLVDGNSENLAGFCAHSSALIMAARRVNPEAAMMDSIEIAEVVIPGLDLPVTFRKFYDRSLGQTCIHVGLIYGVAKGTGMGVRVVSVQP